MAEQDASWHVIVDDQQRGPLTDAEVFEHLRDGLLAGSDLIWRPGFPAWKSISEMGDFWQPPKRTPVQVAPKHVHEVDRTNAPSAGERWSLWKSSNIGLLVSAFTLLLQIGIGQGFELANYAHTASAATISGLIGQILGVPLIFVLIAVVRNLLNRQQQKSSASAVRGARTFVMLLVCILGSLMVYGKIFFSSSEEISGETRKTFIASAARGCVQKQRSLGQNVTEAQIDKYCNCTSEKIANSMTYKQLGIEPDASVLADLKQKAEAAGYACR